MLGWYATSITYEYDERPLNQSPETSSLGIYDVVDTNVEKEKEQLRSLIPAQILGHHDRLIARGKKSVAVVRNQVCTGCHMRLPIGTINTLMQGTDIQLCDTCGRYLYLPDPAESQFVENVAAAKPAPKTRKRKALAHAAA